VVQPNDSGVVPALKKYWHELADWGFAGVSDAIDVLAGISRKWRGDAAIARWFEAVAHFAPAGLLPWELRREYPLHLVGPNPNAFGLTHATAFDVAASAWLKPYLLLKRGRAVDGGTHRDEAERTIGAAVDEVEKGGTIVRVYAPENVPLLPLEALRWYDVTDTAALLRAYLWLIKSESGWGQLGADGRPRRLLLPRDEANGEVKRGDTKGGVDPSVYAKLLLSQRGGTYTYDAEFRRKYFMWRCAFVMSLLDLSEKSKFYECLALSEALAVHRSARARP
jgi:hypothetical protein